MIEEKVKESIKSMSGHAIIMAGSGSDEPWIEKIAKELGKFKINYNTIICSAHKQADKLIETIHDLNEIGGLYSIVAVAGGTDALSGTASYHALAPVISCPPDVPKAGIPTGHNTSCLTNPPGSPNAYIARPGNVAKFLAQIYAPFNPEVKKLLEDSIASKISGLEKDNGTIGGKYNSLVE